MSFEAWKPRSEGGPTAATAPRVARLLAPGLEESAAPMEWRLAGAARPAPQGAPEQALASQMKQLQQHCEQRVREAHAAGQREGENAAKARASAEAAPTLEKLAQSIEELAEMRGRLRKQAEADIVKLALAIARRVLRREIAIDPDAMRGLALVALEKLQAQETCRVRVHPAHANQIAAMVKKNNAAVAIDVIPDGALAPGGIVFETNQGNLDASVESQLEEIERGLADHLRKHS